MNSQLFDQLIHCKCFGFLFNQERQRLLRTLGPSPHNDLEYCRQQLNIHRQWVLHGDSENKDEDRNTYPLPHKAYGDRERAKKAEPEKPRTVQSQHVERVAKTALIFKDAETKRPAWDRKGSASFIVTDNDCDKSTLEAYCHEREKAKERERGSDSDGAPVASVSAAEPTTQSLQVDEVAAKIDKIFEKS